MFCELSVNINKKESRNFIKALANFIMFLDQVSKEFVLKWQQVLDSFLLHDFNVYRSTVEHVYLDFQTRVILDMCN